MTFWFEFVLFYFHVNMVLAHSYYKWSHDVDNLNSHSLWKWISIYSLSSTDLKPVWWTVLQVNHHEHTHTHTPTCYHTSFSCDFLLCIRPFKKNVFPICFTFCTNCVSAIFCCHSVEKCLQIFVSVIDSLVCSLIAEHFLQSCCVTVFSSVCFYILPWQIKKATLNSLFYELFQFQGQLKQSLDWFPVLTF